LERYDLVRAAHLTDLSSLFWVVLPGFVDRPEGSPPENLFIQKFAEPGDPFQAAQKVKMLRLCG
jgi:hypothetical protein